ncbi:MAG: hypothetical protein LAO19_13165 [Acidobacteriia bacterium]|nr:hypothetical protein [Terriglobia bacterium]
MNNGSGPEFPLWWLEESRRNIDSLKDIASHLHEKTEAYNNHPSGVRGETNDVEKQIVEDIRVLRQQVSDDAERESFKSVILSKGTPRTSINTGV